MSSAAHAPIAPSGLHALVQCPGSLVLRATVPADQLLPEDTDDAAEGEAAHWALSEMLQGRSVQDGTVAPNGIRIDREMLDAADLAVEAVLKRADGATLAVESAVSIQRVHEQCWGTPDVRWWGPSRHLHVFDFKYGHEVVEVFENWQLLAYAAGAIDQAGLHDLDVTVTLGIVQPRAQHRDGPVRTWTFRAPAMRALINVASSAAHEALGPDPKLRAGPACKNCRARVVCPANTAASSSAMQLAYQALPQVLTPNAVGVELRYAQAALKLLKARVDALEQQALATLRSGKDVPHFRVEHAEGRERWKKTDAEIIALGKMLGFDFAKPQEAITPRQAGLRGLPDVLRASFAERNAGAAELVPDDGSKARRVFGTT